MFDPWNGPSFGNSGNAVSGFRLLVVSEGHHADGAGYEIGTKHPELTQATVEVYKHGERKPWMRTFDNIAAAIAGQPKPDLGREGVNAVWDAIAFYNYIPVIAATSARKERPTGEMWESGAEPFREVVRKVRPDAIIVAGYRLWDQIIYRHAAQRHHVKTDPANPIVPLDDVGGLLALKMPHPSTAFSPSVWHAQIVRLMEQASKVRGSA